MGAPAWGTRIVAAVAAVAVIGVGAALAVPVVMGSGTPTISVDEVPDMTHAALVKEYEEKVKAREAEMAAAKERQATLQQDALEAKAAKEAKATEEQDKAHDEAATEEKTKADDETVEKESSSTQTKDSSDTKESKDSTSKDSDKDKDQSTKPDWWPEHVWAHVVSCTVSEDGQTVTGTWDVWVKYGGDWLFVSASDDPDEVSGTDGDKTKIVYADRTATLHKEHDGMAKYRGGPVHITLANAADSSETHTFKADLWVVAKNDGTCPA
jgi:hypothetical protein